MLTSPSFLQISFAEYFLWINETVGVRFLLEKSCPITVTLSSESKFEYKFDATISSGLAIMACNRNKYKPTAQRTMKEIDLGFKTYDNNGLISKII